MVSYVLMGLAEYAPIVTIESLDNLITKSDINNHNNKAPLPRGPIHQELWFPFRLPPTRNWRLMNPDQVFITRFEPRLIHTYVMFTVSTSSFNNNLLDVNTMSHTCPYLRCETDVLPYRTSLQ